MENIRVLTGNAAGEGGHSNVGTGTGVDWATASHPTYANTGLIFDGTEPPAALQSALLALAASTAARGTLKPWNSSVSADAKPSIATGPSFVELDLGVSNQKVAFLAGSTATALNSTTPDGGDAAAVDFEAGYGWECCFQLWFDESTFSPIATIKPAHVGNNNPGAPLTVVLCSGIATSGTQFFQTRATVYNSGGFRPSAVLSQVAYNVSGTGNVGTPTTLAPKGGGNQLNPWGHFSLNEWVAFGQWMQRATDADDKNGKVRTLINGAVVSESPSADVWMTTASRMERFFGLLNEYVSLDSIKVRYAPPIRCMKVPDADLEEAFPLRWDLNVSRGNHLVRLFPAAFVGHPMTIETYSGSPTLPTLGRHPMAGGVFPGRMEFVVSAGSGDVSLSKTPDLWDGDPDFTIFGAHGWTHISLNSAAPNGGQITFEVLDENNGVQPLCSVTIDDTGTGAVIINGDTVLSGRTDVPANARWQPIISISPGRTVVTLHQMSLVSKTSKLLRTFEDTNVYESGDGIGRAQVFMTGVAGPRRLSHASVSVHREYDLVTGDSYTDGTAAESYSISSITGANTINVPSMGSRAPAAGTTVTIAGNSTPGNNGDWTVASSTATTIVVTGTLTNTGASGTVDLLSPDMTGTANRIGMYIPDRSDADGIPGGYNVVPFDVEHDLDGYHALISIARSGGRLSEDLANVLPQAPHIPYPNVMALCYDVNDCGAPSSESASITKAEEIAQDKLDLAKWAKARGGKTILSPSPNLYSAGVAAGYSNRYYRRTPNRVWDQVKRLIQSSDVASSVYLVDVLACVDSGSITLVSDGIHPDNASAPVYGLGYHQCLDVLDETAGFNLNGTLRRVGGRSRGAIGSAIGT